MKDEREVELVGLISRIGQQVYDSPTVSNVPFTQNVSTWKLCASVEPPIGCTGVPVDRLQLGWLGSTHRLEQRAQFDSNYPRMPCFLLARTGFQLLRARLPAEWARGAGGTVRPTPTLLPSPPSECGLRPSALGTHMYRAPRTYRQGG